MAACSHSSSGSNDANEEAATRRRVSIFHQRVGLLKDLIRAHLIILIICFFCCCFLAKIALQMGQKLSHNTETFQGYNNISIFIIMSLSYEINILELFLLEMRSSAEFLRANQRGPAGTTRFPHFQAERRASRQPFAIMRRGRIGRNSK